MKDHNQALEEIRPIVEEHFEEKGEEFVPGESPIRLSEPTFGSEEVTESIDSLLSTWVTMGDKVERFEEMWADYVETKYSVMVNSGSSANLLALKALEGSRIPKGSEVILPAVAWSTSVFPILDIGAKPVFVDVDRETYTIDTEAIKEAITEDTSAILPVHLLGNPAEIDVIMELADDHDLAVIEDSCEAHGAEYRGQKVGSFGDLSTFSFFFSHHISTIEGGTVMINSPELLDDVRMRRAHGWVRETENKERYTDENPDIDDRFLFAKHGYNLRPTDIQGGFGIHQVKKLDSFINSRRENAEYLTNRLEEFSDIFHLLEERDHTRGSWFAYPLLLRPDAPFSREKLQNHLEAHKIETRPILAGDLTKQPVIDDIPHRISGSLSSSGYIHEQGLFIGNHHGLTHEMLDYISEVIQKLVAAES